MVVEMGLGMPHLGLRGKARGQVHARTICRVSVTLLTSLTSRALLHDASLHHVILQGLAFLRFVLSIKTIASQMSIHCCQVSFLAQASQHVATTP